MTYKRKKSEINLSTRTKHLVPNAVSLWRFHCNRIQQYGRCIATASVRTVLSVLAVSKEVGFKL